MQKKHLVAAILLIVIIVMISCKSKESPVPLITPQEISTPINTPTFEPESAIPTITPEELEQELIKKLIADSEATENLIEYQNTIENEILVAYISSEPLIKSGYYAIVVPQTHLVSLSINTPSDLEDWKNTIKMRFNEGGFQVDALVDRFFELNMSSSLLTIKSSIADGYYVNHDGKFWKYQVDVSREWYQEGSSWLAFLLKYFPHFNLDLCISRPAYDPETGYAIISSLWGSCWGPGGGGIESMTLLIYKDGKITELWKAYEISVQMAMADVEPEVYANMRYVTPSKLLEE